MGNVTTLEEALEFVQEVGICTIFSEKVAGVPSLYDAVDLPDDEGETRWGARVEAVWAWKIELPTLYPDEVFYGKIPGGHAALMSMNYLREVHYSKAHKPVSACRELARSVYEIVRLSPGTTTEIRTEAMERFGCSKSRFETALKELQITLNIARLNEPGVTRDTWVPFSEVYESLLDL